MTSSLPLTCGTRHGTTVAVRVLLALLSPLLIRPASAAPPSQQKYVISIGTASERLASGTLWLYSYSWYGLQHYKLAVIQNGLAVVPLDDDRLKQEVDPHPNTSGYVIAIQASEHLWYRSPDIPSNDFWTDLPRAIRSLGNSTQLPTGETQLVLPAPAVRHITLLYPDGRPKTNTDLAVSIYLWDWNHCGVHAGLPLGNFRTDAKGAIEVLAPMVPLYLDGLEYYAYAGAGPAGAAYSSNIGMKIRADDPVVIKVAWDLPDFSVKMQVLTASGRPQPGVDVWGTWNSNTCGGADRIARTDAQGIVGLDLDATFTALSLMLGGPYSARDPEGDRNTRGLTDAELRELFSKHKLVIRWDPVAKQAPAMLARPVGYWTSAPVLCDDVSGEWADPENGGTWTLSQTGEIITGSLTMFKGGNCGSISWHVTGRMNGRLATLTASEPEPSVDKCGVAAAGSIAVVRAPYCNAAGHGTAELGK